MHVVPVASDFALQGKSSSQRVQRLALITRTKHFEALVYAADGCSGRSTPTRWRQLRAFVPSTDVHASEAARHAAALSRKYARDRATRYALGRDRELRVFSRYLVVNCGS